MTSELRVDKIHNEGGDNDSGIDLSTNDQIVLKTANTTRLTMDATGQTTIVGEGGGTTTSVQQGLAKAWARVAYEGTAQDSFNISSTTETSDSLYTITINNDMNTANYSLTAATHYAEIIAINSTATGNYALRTYERTDSLTANDNQTHSTVHGDLA